ncbi:MAG TPA: VWA domain-containing protein [Vicinamibacterales bacterium]|nr:VWA domain-containing protein [Vicinamibacterales bacterium]
MRMCCTLAALLIAGFLLVPLDATAPQDRPTFKAESELVVLHVSVRDRDGRYVTGLDKDNFTVIDDGKPQTLQMFSGDEVPASIGVLIDNSNSMRPSRERVVASAVEFAGHSHPRDEIFVLTFNEHVRQPWGPAVTGEMDLERFRSSMARAIVAHGMTAIYDAVIEGLRRVGSGALTRQVLIVISDGDDNASAASREEVLAQVRESDAMIYTVVLTDPLTRDGDPRFLRRLAQATGGEAHAPRRVDDVPAAFERISRDIRSAYTLAYAPAHHRSDDGERHRRAVQVYVRAKDGRVLSVRARDGYYERHEESGPR